MTQLAAKSNTELDESGFGMYLLLGTLAVVVLLVVLMLTVDAPERATTRHHIADAGVAKTVVVDSVNYVRITNLTGQSYTLSKVPQGFEGTSLAVEEDVFYNGTRTRYLCGGVPKNCGVLQ